MSPPNDRHDREHETIAELKRRLNELEGVIRRFDGGAVDGSVASTLAGLSAQLEPLRDMAPQRAKLLPAAIDRLGALRSSLARPDWTGVGALSGDDGVPFIGALVDRDSRTVQAAAQAQQVSVKP
ncbi:hypothetical protein AKJ09_06181 [Labilithrix luteola]|uniref:Uncharacterized protein n=1 Tax=Labilithrix luteola TaxID=1391654 RepID=A0A0K1Q199_9BACT|nr:hypothetical protein [Labilithrix luteola]AKU99517.1 hypothetical protein AKJ09_06181 [Labilithrix luteola]